METLYWQSSLFHFYFCIRWTDRHPVSYQGWSNLNYGQDPFTELQENYLNERKGINIYDLLVSTDETNYPLLKIKKESSVNIYPHSRESVQCTIMMIFNMAETQWVSVPCEEELEPVVVCYKDSNDSNELNNKSTIFQFLQIPAAIISHFSKQAVVSFHNG